MIRVRKRTITKALFPQVTAHTKGRHVIITTFFEARANMCKHNS